MVSAPNLYTLLENEADLLQVAAFSLGVTTFRVCSVDVVTRELEPNLANSDVGLGFPVFDLAGPISFNLMR